MIAGCDHLLLSDSGFASWSMEGAAIDLSCAPTNVIAGQGYLFWSMQFRQTFPTLAYARVREGDIGPATLSGEIMRRPTEIVLPDSRDAQRTADGLWRVPLFPQDPAHYLHAASYNWVLAPDQTRALVPHAAWLLARVRLRHRNFSPHIGSWRAIEWLVSAAGQTPERMADLGGWVEQHARRGRITEPNAAMLGGLEAAFALANV